MSRLIIYKASAGSGKTYALTREYLKLVIDNPLKFRNILAVTFTNKATWEMKQRILTELKGLTENSDPNLKKYFINAFGFTDNQLKDISNEILELILHGYSRFHVETIDKFFQRVIRSFAREINLPAGYNIELDDSLIREEAVDRLLFEAENDKFLQEWLTGFAEAKILEGQHWNLKMDILRFSEEIFKEKFRESSSILIKQLEDREKINNYLNNLLRYSKWFENHLKELGCNALRNMQESGLTPDDFRNKEKGPGGFLKKISSGVIPELTEPIRNCWNNQEAWYAKSSELIKEIKSAYESGLNNIIGEVIKFYDQYYYSYNTIRFTRPFIYSLGILTDISKKVSDYLNERNIFLLSDASFFLREIIGNNETPFIYEKMGNYFHHYMIDEFQDTSRMQWFNFRPLLDNSIAQNYVNFVVGDVKQSIYRWRNSDWEILSEGMEQDFSEDLLEIRTLTENWRSREVIVNFNNLFFREVRELIGNRFTEVNKTDNHAYFQERFNKAYSDVIQQLPASRETKGGNVEISFLVSGDVETWQDKADEKVIQTIMTLQDHGFEPRDIAILVRKNDEGKRIANLLLKHKTEQIKQSTYKFDLISDESLFLACSSVVILILSTMRFLVNPDDKINKAIILNEWKRYISGDVLSSDGHVFFHTAGSDDGNQFTKYLPEDFISLAGVLRYLSLNEITERIISMFDLCKLDQELPYLHAFQDVIMEYGRNNPPDINSFLRWWDEHGRNKSLSASEGQNAIRIMTIHKAKGLQFKAVIIPYCDWTLDHNQSIVLWCTPNNSPFNELNLIPVRYSSGLVHTIFSDDYKKERFRIHVDNLNLLYVAFTRSQESLFVMTPYNPEKQKELKHISDLLGLLITSTQGNSLFPGNYNPDHLILKLGEVIDNPPSVIKVPAPVCITDQVSNVTSKTKLKVHWQGIDFFDHEAEKRINYGKFIHEVLQNMDTREDLDKALGKVFRDGKLTDREKEYVLEELKGILNIGIVKDWFSGRWKVNRERDILVRGGRVKRPDRVMSANGQTIVVDYKYVSSKRQEHEDQVREYIKLLREMDSGEVCGYLCYIKQKEIVPVDKQS